jgi:hypothetical protein
VRSGRGDAQPAGFELRRQQAEGAGRHTPGDKPRHGAEREDADHEPPAAKRVGRHLPIQRRRWAWTSLVGIHKKSRAQAKPRSRRWSFALEDIAIITVSTNEAHSIGPCLPAPSSTWTTCARTSQDSTRSHVTSSLSWCRPSSAGPRRAVPQPRLLARKNAPGAHYPRSSAATAAEDSRVSLPRDAGLGPAETWPR